MMQEWAQTKARPQANHQKEGARPLPQPNITGVVVKVKEQAHTKETSDPHTPAGPLPECQSRTTQSQATHTCSVSFSLSSVCLPMKARLAAQASPDNKKASMHEASPQTCTLACMQNRSSPAAPPAYRSQIHLTYHPYVAHPKPKLACPHVHHTTCLIYPHNPPRNHSPPLTHTKNPNQPQASHRPSYPVSPPPSIIPHHHHHHASCITPPRR